MRTVRFSKWKYYITFWITTTIICVFYNEVYVYYANTFKWFNLRCEKKKDCTNILLVADPQIIGDYSEVKHYITPYSKYDSDRYLKKTYSYAFDFVKPDLVIFLGDLTDEGSVATNEEFYGYVRRVFNIFLYGGNENVRHIWLPGDNDVGGEDFDVLPRKMHRFDRAFSQPEIIKHKNITFFKVNRLTLNLPVYKKRREFFDTSNIFVALSHIPLLFMPSPFVDKMFNKMLPQLLFTGHEHKSMIVSTDALLRQDHQIVPVTPDNNRVFEYTLGIGDVYEIIVPTCSYRMGAKAMGYGYAIIENNEIRFTMLWSPSRFDQLKNYMILVISFVLISLVLKCYICCRYRRCKRFR